MNEHDLKKLRYHLVNRGELINNTAVKVGGTRNMYVPVVMSIGRYWSNGLVPMWQ
jgi:hypothetical protein